MIIQYRDVTEFDSVVFRGPGTLQVVQAEAEELCIEAKANHLDQIRSTVVNRQLQLGIAGQSIVDLSAYRAPIQYRLAVRDLTSLTVKGHGIVHLPDIDRDEFSLTLSGRSAVTLGRLTADRLFVNGAGHARLNVSGDVEFQSVVLNDHASYQAEQLISDVTSMRLLGEAAAEVRTNDQLDAYLSDAAQLTYVGYPDVQKQGGGTVRRRRKQLLEPTQTNNSQNNSQS
ncbi:MAG: GIN domain-containing protein [Pseudomonadales bacterium]